MLGKLFGKKKQTAKAQGRVRSTEALIDEEETIVIDLSSADVPEPDTIRLEVEEPAEVMAPLRAEPLPAAAQVARPRGGEDDTEIWTGSETAEPQQAAAPEPAPGPRDTQLTVGWLVIVSESGRGQNYPVRVGRNRLGRGAQNDIAVQVGDASISKDNHLTIAADPKTKRFFAVPGDSTNLAYLNEEPLLEAREIEDKAVLQAGATVFTFVQFAGNYVDWE